MPYTHGIYFSLRFCPFWEPFILSVYWLLTEHPTACKGTVVGTAGVVLNMIPAQPQPSQILWLLGSDGVAGAEFGGRLCWRQGRWTLRVVLTG